MPGGRGTWEVSPRTRSHAGSDRRVSRPQGVSVSLAADATPPTARSPAWRSHVRVPVSPLCSQRHCSALPRSGWEPRAAHAPASAGPQPPGGKTPSTDARGSGGVASDASLPVPGSSHRHPPPRVLPLPGARPLVSYPLGVHPSQPPGTSECRPGPVGLWAEDGGARRPRGSELPEQRGAWGLPSRCAPGGTPWRRRRGACSQAARARQSCSSPLLRRPRLSPAAVSTRARGHSQWPRSALMPTR